MRLTEKSTNKLEVQFSLFSSNQLPSPLTLQRSIQSQNAGANKETQLRNMFAGVPELFRFMIFSVRGPPEQLNHFFD